MKKEIENIISSWKNEPKESAKRLIDYYGEPDEFSESKLVWYNTFDGWKRTELSNEEIEHNFPAPHKDYLQQYISYKVPVEKFNALGEFDGSVVVDKTKGELSARCGGTSMNFVALNLAHDIITGNRSVDEARKEYTRLYKAFKNGEKESYTQKFQFDITNGNTGDPDFSTV